MLTTHLIASFNAGFSALGCLLLPLILAYPVIMGLLFVWSVLNHDEPSVYRLTSLLSLTGFGMWMAFSGFWSNEPDSTFWNGWRIACILATCVAPLVVSWEIYQLWKLRQWSKNRLLED